jgi:hypothetical protein
MKRNCGPLVTLRLRFNCKMRGKKMELVTSCRNVFLKIFQLIKSLFVISVSEQYKREFNIAVDRINVSRVKIFAITVMVLEGIMIVISFINLKSASK